MMIVLKIIKKKKKKLAFTRANVAWLSTKKKNKKFSTIILLMLMNGMNECVLKTKNKVFSSKMYL